MSMLRPRSWIVVTIVLLAIATGIPKVLRVRGGQNERDDQRCVNQGSDARIAAPVVCAMQRRLSWKSENPPHLLRVGSQRRSHVAVAWPPYLVINRRSEDGWLMFRVGFRYDRTWRGYIFPTAALKVLDHPVQY